MARITDTYNGNLVWKVRKTVPGRTPCADQRRRLPIERLDGECDEYQYVKYYNAINRDDASANIGVFFAVWEHLSAELQKLHDCRIIHGYLSCDSIVFTDSNTVVFTNFYGMPHVPFSEDAVRRDKLNLLDAMRHLFDCEEPCRYPLKKLCDAFEKAKCDSVWLRTCLNNNLRMSSCTFVAKLNDDMYECVYSLSRARCVVKFTNEVETRAYKTLSPLQVCPTLLFSRLNDQCFGSYVIYAKIATRCQLTVDVDTTMLAFRLLDTMHAQKITHLNIGSDSLVCQPLKGTNNLKRLVFVDYSLSRSVVDAGNFELSTAVHSMELRREPHRSDLTKSDDVFALAVLLLCTITHVKASQIEYAIGSKKAARKAYADVRDLFNRELDGSSGPLCKILLEAIVPHDERPRACDIVTKLRLIKHSD